MTETTIEERVLTLNGPVGKENVDTLDAASWPTWKKVALTQAIRVSGPFTVLTSEGELSCADGYLAMDARGYPYPIATDEFHLIYAPADEEQASSPGSWFHASLQEISVAHAEGILTKPVAQEAAHRILRGAGLMDAEPS